ncbi:hypothetical protein LTR53_006162 [Teratosphaeriaceae sp. CCFEE 6253]|nr:hypothetical protein LTR53_006162 [Teratosphaeriaceae sp. CCFEE 6253]
MDRLASPAFTALPASTTADAKLTDFRAAVDSHHSAVTASIRRNPYYTSTSTPTSASASTALTTSPLPPTRLLPSTPLAKPQPATPASTTSSSLVHPAIASAAALAPRTVHLSFGAHSLSGTLHLISTQDYLANLYPRFFALSPDASAASTTTYPRFADARDPVCLVHHVQGVTWGLGAESPAARPTLPGDETLFPEQQAKEVAPAGAFQAVTDETAVWVRGGFLGTCTLEGQFFPQHPSLENVILAFPLHAPLGVRHPTVFGRATRTADFPPRPVGPEVLRAVARLQAATRTPGALTLAGDFSKRFLRQHLADLLDKRTGALRREHALYPHRNNFSLVGARVWRSVCGSEGGKFAVDLGTGDVGMGEGGMGVAGEGVEGEMPRGYARYLFADACADEDVTHEVKQEDSPTGPSSPRTSTSSSSTPQPQSSSSSSSSTVEQEEGEQGPREWMPGCEGLLEVGYVDPDPAATARDVAETERVLSRAVAPGQEGGADCGV